MTRKFAATALAVAGLTLATGALADDDGWWDDDDDDYRVTDTRYDDNRDQRNRDRRYRQTRYGGDDYVYADVVDVEPIYRYVRVRQPQRECWHEEVHERSRRGHHDTARASIVGGVIGGAIGRQFGDGKGRDAMTVVGTLIGSAVGHDNAARRHYDDYDRPRVRTVERCETRYQSYEDRRIEGYNVTYVYGGREYTTRTRQEPGHRVRVRVAVTPVRYGRY